MFDQGPKVGAPLIQASEDAVLFGNIKEIDGILEIVREDEKFPSNLRNGLEALLYFRIHYGRGGVMEPVANDDKLKIFQMEAAWGREVIEMIGHYPDLTEAKYA
jgi:hypothetical protein